MKVPTSCVIFIVTFVSSANCWGNTYPKTVEVGSGCPYDDERIEVCDADGKGYKRYQCKGGWKKVNGNWVRKKKVWYARGENRCPAVESKCRCEENVWVEQDCECVNPRQFPDWPDIGILRWNGMSNLIVHFFKTMVISVIINLVILF